MPRLSTLIKGADGSTSSFQRGAMCDQHERCDGIRFPNQSEQQVFSSSGLLVEPRRFV